MFLEELDRKVANKKLVKKEHICSKCNDTGMVRVEGSERFKYCSCRGLKIAERLLGPMLFKYFEPNNEDVLSWIENPKFNLENLFIKYSLESDLKKLIALYLFRHKVDNFIFMDSYRVMDIFLGNDKSYNSVRELVLSNSIIFVQLGKTEMNIKRFDESFAQFLSLSEMTPELHLWLLSPYPPSSMKLAEFYSGYSQKIFQSKIFTKIGL